MNKARKIDILYKRAKGQQYNATQSELEELYKYKVDFNEGDFYTTRENITKYVTAVDNGSRLPFYDWCMNNKLADKRRKGSNEAAISGRNKEKAMSAIFIGWITWGMAVYWLFNEKLSVGVCAIIGAGISYALVRTSRKTAPFSVIVLPLLLLVLFGR